MSGVTQTCFDRCWFGSCPEQTLLSFLLMWGYDPEEYIDLLDNIAEAEAHKKDAEEHPEKYDKEEILFLDSDIEYWKEEMYYMVSDWKPDGKPDMEKETEIIKK